MLDCKPFGASGLDMVVQNVQEKSARQLGGRAAGDRENISLGLVTRRVKVASNLTPKIHRPLLIRSR